jgi:hypothetical protein
VDANFVAPRKSSSDSRGIIMNFKKQKSRKSSLSSGADVEMIDTSSKPKKLPVIQEEDHTLELNSENSAGKEEEQVADDASKK